MHERLRYAFDKLGMSFDQYLDTVSPKYVPKWEKNLAKVTFNHEQATFLKENFTHIHIIVFACDFCPDCQSALPIVHKMAELSDFVDWKIVDRDADKELFRNYHLNNKALIPTMLFLNQEFYEIVRWVERSTYGYKLLYESKKLAEGRTQQEFQEIKSANFKSHSAKLFQENINEIFDSLQRSVYIVNAGQIEIKS